MIKKTSDKIVVVTRMTALEELIERMNSREQARFYIEHMGASFDEYEAADATYRRAAALLREALPKRIRTQWIDRRFLPNFTFGDHDLVVTLGPDGLVVNTAKYLDGQPLLAFNPDSTRIDGLLVPFSVADAESLILLALASELHASQVTMARATLSDGQTLDAVNDLFIGQKTHTSARYTIRQGDHEETQSSSGIIISTGAGSTGWLRSVITGAASLVESKTGWNGCRALREDYRFDREAERLVYSVREPFVSKISAANLVHGLIDTRNPFDVISRMPQNGVIFSDGVEEDHLDFNSGATARIEVAPRKLNLLISSGAKERAEWNAGQSHEGAEIEQTKINQSTGRFETQSVARPGRMSRPGGPWSMKDDVGTR